MNSKFNQILLNKKRGYDCVFCDEYYKNGDVFLNKVAAVLAKDIDVLELKSKELTSAEFLTVAKKLRELTANLDALMIIYDRIDIAKLSEADGIILDKNSVDIKSARTLIEDDMILGYCCNNQSEAEIAETDGADYIIAKEKYPNIKIRIFVQ